MRSSQSTSTSIGEYFCIENWAGNGYYSTRDGIGKECGIYWPYEIKFDSTGTGYFTAFGSASLRKITPDAVVTTIANRTTSGQYFSSLRGLALDKSGNIYLCDTGNSVLRIVKTNGICETLITNRTLLSPYGVVVDDNGVIYVSSGNCVFTVVDGQVEVFAGNPTDRGGNQDGVGSEARFLLPQGMEIDEDGNIILADCRNNTIRKIDKNRTVTTIAKGFKSPYGVVLDKKGNIFVADYGNSDVKRINKKGEVHSLAIKAEFLEKPESLQYPTGVSLDHLGNLVICDCYNHIIRRFKCKLAVEALKWPHCEFLPDSVHTSVEEILCVLVKRPPICLPRDIVTKLVKTIIQYWPY